MDYNNPPILGGAYIGTKSGKIINVNNLQVSDIEIEDIAHALSMICRGYGNCRKFYSVAEHSIFVSGQLPERYRLLGLLHDASEYLLGDVHRGIKYQLDVYLSMERWIQELIWIKFCPLQYNEEGLGLVHKADRSVLAAELEEVFFNQGMAKALIDTKPADIKPKFWNPEEARVIFLRQIAKCGGHLCR
jgi:hypothetical protein